MADAKSEAHVAIMPSPGMGHLIPAVELAKRLVHRHGFTVTLIIAGQGPPSNSQRCVLESLPPSIASAFLSPVDLTDLPPAARAETRITLTVTRSNPELRRLLRSFTAQGRLPSALVVDLFGTDAFDVAAEFHVSPYVFYPSTANVLSLFLNLPKLDEVIPGEYRDLTEPVHLPGCVPISGRDLLDPIQDRKDDAYKWLLHHTKRYKEAQGILVNTFIELEPNAIKSIQEPAPDKPTIYPVGPLVNMGSSDPNRTDESECLKWLDKQPLASVLYISFGSGGTVTCEQLNELALGLEKSVQRFLWVIRSPSSSANSSFFDSHNQNDPLSFLPTGFLDRTVDKSMVVPSWARQAQILAHPSTRGFLTHCGWNSTLESVVNGVPLIAWPLYAEQKMNGVLLTDGIKVALRPRPRSDGIIRKEEIGRVVKVLIEGGEGKEMRKRMKILQEAARRVLRDDGSSARALDEVASKWKAHQMELDGIH
ncbi:PREDICTED: UDP-glycosyltransferase 72B1-like isoform X2 [Tarenaya hassleriana]|uniref:UDP-glycosyltransferase 72B1-like isoform X2 n=1 Tax=Tarenaya hassleriana TaxID=28532 RepID=UPI0008FD374C|nr:PREDICTED: UDP-glycosyltransferase 72B1-like isoform X2 [Tarenaya hassleriana]